jgi:DNA mismatch endonuclease (patch repair protein)
MRAVRSKNTTPEIRVRTILRSLGYRYRLHAAAVPGKPDVIFPRNHIAVFVHGCFWHGHTCDRGSRVPRNNRDYWIAKIARNKTRDRRVARQLRLQGWSVLSIWECELRDELRLQRRIERFFKMRSRGS